MTELQTTLDLISEWLFLILPLAILQLVLMVTALVSIIRKKGVTGAEKLPWILLSILVNTFGPIIYFVVGSGKLDEKAAEREERE